MVAKKKHKAHGSILGPAKHSPAAAKAAPQREAQPGEHTPTGKGDTPKGQHPQNGSPHHDGKAREQSKGVREGIDRTTGKKRGTLFSAAPAARKPAAKRFAAVAPPAADALSGKTRGAAPHKGQNHQRRGPEGAAPAGGQHAGKKRKRYRGKSKRPDLSALLPELHKVSEEDAAKRATPPVATTPQDKPTAQPDAQADTALHDGRSNWERLKATIATHNAAHPLAANPTPRPHRPPGKRRKVAHAPSQAAGTAVCADGVLAGKLVAKAPSEEATSVVGLDCEMVGVGLDGLRSALARVCVINGHGNVLLDTFVAPKEKVTDFRTKFSGIRPADLKAAVPLEDAMTRTHALLQGRVVVGHALHNDFKVLMLQGTVPKESIRDTAVHPPLMSAAREGAKLRARALRHLAADELGAAIQDGEHSPVDDARAALYVYQRHAVAWEAGLRSGLYKIRGLKASGRLAKGDYRQMAMRAGPVHAKAAAAGGEGGASDDEFGAPSAAGVARMKQRLAVEGAQED